MGPNWLKLALLVQTIATIQLFSFVCVIIALNGSSSECIIHILLNNFCCLFIRELVY